MLCCDIHTRNETRDVLQAMGKTVFTLADVMSAPVNGSGYHDKYGMLGSNKATEEKLKLFPGTASQWWTASRPGSQRSGGCTWR